MAQPVKTAKPGNEPFAKGSIIWRKYGPLPVWAWALILLGVLLAWSVWRRNKASDETTEADLAYVDELPGDQTSGPVFILPQQPTPNINITAPITTVPSAPAGGGRPAPPLIPAVPSSPVPPKPVPAPPGRYVTVSKWPDNTKPKESTLWDIAAHYLGSGNAWGKIWNDPRNKAVRDKRKDPKKIQPGDRFFVPGAK